MISVLIADDNPNLRSALALLLETRLHIHIIREAWTMEELLKQAEALQPDLVIMDWKLPGPTTEDRIQALRALAPNLKIVVANTRRETEMRAKDADAFISKDSPPEQIIAIIKQVLEQRKRS